MLMRTLKILVALVKKLAREEGLSCVSTSKICRVHNNNKALYNCTGGGGEGREKGLSQATRALHNANIVSDGCSGYLGVHQSHRFRHRRPKTGETGIQVLRSHSQVLYTGLALYHKTTKTARKKKFH